MQVFAPFPLVAAPLLASVVSAQGTVWFDSELGPGLPDPTGNTSDVAVADFNGDGDLDLLFKEEGGGKLMLGNGAAGFAILPGAVPPSDEGAGPAAAGDVDGDGDVDALLARDEWIDVLTNDGTGILSLLLSVPAVSPFYPPVELRLVDLDGDALLDLVQCSFDRAQYHPGNGSGGFGEPVVIPSETGGFPRGLYPYDLEGDGDLDLFVLFTDGSEVLLNQGTGTFVPVAILPEGLEAEVGDLDGDGDGDVFLADDFFNGHYVYLNQPGGFTPAQAVPQPSLVSTMDVELNDYDRDGDLDVFMSFNLAEPIAWDNDGSGTLALAAPVFPDDVMRSADIEFADVDADGNEDVIGAGLDKSLYLADGQGSFLGLDPVTFIELRDSRGLADVDGDGDVDVFNALDELPGNGEWLYRNDGWGNFTPDPGPAPTIEGLATAYDLGDLDLDGDEDVLVGRADYGGVFFTPLEEIVLVNDGTGTFAADPSRVVAPPDNTLDVLLVDVEGDGDLDAFVANRDPADLTEKNQVLVNDGTGVLVYDAAKLPDDNVAFGVESGDFDLDGDVDLMLRATAPFFGAPSEFQDRLLLNDGTGVFDDVTGTHMPNLDDVDTRVLLVEDVDLDGDLDAYLVVANVTFFLAPGPQQDRLLLNDGAAHFSDASAGLPALSYDPQSAVFTDVDLDGDPDLVRGNSATLGGALPDELYLNDGAGGFTAAPGEPVPGGQTLAGAALAAADVDRDGDEDLVASGRFFRSLRRELVLKSPVRVGETLALEVRSLGAPAPYVLAFAAGAIALDLGPFGVLGLDVTGPFGVIASGFLDGSEAVDVPVPDVPALVGQTFYWQALLDAPPHFSRVVATTVAG